MALSQAVSKPSAEATAIPLRLPSPMRGEVPGVTKRVLGCCGVPSTSSAGPASTVIRNWQRHPALRFESRGQRVSAGQVLPVDGCNVVTWKVPPMAFKLTYRDGETDDYDDSTRWAVEDGVLKMGREFGEWTVLVSPSHWATIEVEGDQKREASDRDEDSDQHRDEERGDHDEDHGKD